MNISFIIHCNVKIGDNNNISPISLIKSNSNKPSLRIGQLSQKYNLSTFNEKSFEDNEFTTNEKKCVNRIPLDITITITSGNMSNNSDSNDDK